VGAIRRSSPVESDRSEFGWLQCPVKSDSSGGVGVMREIKRGILCRTCGILSRMANETVICTYRVRASKEENFSELLVKHWEVLHQLEFVTDERSLLLRNVDEPTYVEVFTWVEGGFARAHEHPDVLGIWEQMDPLLEERDGMPKWDFPHYVRLNSLN